MGQYRYGKIQGIRDNKQSQSFKYYLIKEHSDRCLTLSNKLQISKLKNEILYNEKKYRRYHYIR